MKLIATILLISALTSCTATTKTTQKPVRTLKLRVTHIDRGAERTEIWAVSKPFIYVADCPTIPDTLKVGSIITAEPKPDSCLCPCVFNKFVKRKKK